MERITLNIWIVEIIGLLIKYPAGLWPKASNLKMKLEEYLEKLNKV